MNSNKKTTAILLVILLILQALIPIISLRAYAAESTETIAIQTAEDLLAFAANCTLDSWSKKKSVVLKNNISLENVEFAGIPTFGGTFDGGGHTISGFTLSENVTPAGFFGVLQEGAVVKNLHIKGNGTSAGATTGGIAGENNGTIADCSFSGVICGTDDTGGIAGINSLTGVIRNCETSGAVFGENRTGGIIGYNLGTVESCWNRSYVNISSVDPTIKLDDIPLDINTDISKLYTLDTKNAASDTGGIAGYSSGIITSCVNYSTIGYQHIGYNVGGIAGRSCGYIDRCTSCAEVYGRKDVGGIVGQMEPY
ncbi:MAG: hypothetical protein ACI4V1_07590, partial [Eubacteriales bacterium]